MSDVRAPRILAIAGSPRRRGNTDALLEACAAGIGDGGGEVDLLVVSEAGIGPCTGCNSCSKDGACVILDGMQDVYPRIDAADAIVVATPVYFATVPSVLKALYDRCQPYWAARYVLGRPVLRRRPAGLLVAGGGGDPFGDACAITTSRSVFAVLGLDCLHEVRVEADQRGDVLARDASVAAARAVGEALVREAFERAAGA